MPETECRGAVQPQISPRGRCGTAPGTPFRPSKRIWAPLPKKLTPKAIGNNILNYLSGSMAPLIPVLMCAGLFKTVGVILGPTMAGVVSETSDIYILMNML